MQLSDSKNETGTGHGVLYPSRPEGKLTVIVAAPAVRVPAAAVVEAFMASAAVRVPGAAVFEAIRSRRGCAIGTAATARVHGAAHVDPKSREPADELVDDRL